MSRFRVTIIPSLTVRRKWRLHYVDSASSVLLSGCVFRFVTINRPMVIHHRSQITDHSDNQKSRPDRTRHQTTLSSEH